MGRARFRIALLTAMLLLIAACGGDDDDGDTSATTTARDEPGTELTASFRGVTATTIKVAIVMVDYDAIKQFVDFNRGDQQRTAQVFVDALNDAGGVLGRKIEPVFRSYSPIGNAAALEVCTSLTEDEEVFAVLGVFIDFSGDAQLCLTREHETIHIGHELRQAFIDEAPPGLLLTPDITQERRIDVLMNLVEQVGTLDDKKVAVLADQETEPNVGKVIGPALERLGLEQGSTAVLSIAGTDTSAAQAQLDSFIEKWKSEKVDALIMSGLQVSAKQFVEKIRAAMPDLMLLTDGPSGTRAAAQDEVVAGRNPNPYEGLISAEGLTESEWFATPSNQECVETYEGATGETVVSPGELGPGPDGKRIEVHIAVRDFCGELDMFKQIAEKAGPELTNDSWVKAVHGFGKIELVGAEIASLGEGKYDADDGFRLVAFDSSIGDKGDWRPITDLADATEG